MSEILSLLLVAVGLSADAFAVTVSNVICYGDLPRKKKLAMPAVFGVMQGVMPVVGYFLGLTFAQYIEAVDHWIALVLLVVLGGKMIVETVLENKKSRSAQGGEEEEITPAKTLPYKTIFVQGVATSIDALAVGLTLAVAFSLNVFLSAGIIAAVTFVICFAGLYVGKVGKYLKGYAGIVGGAILIAVGVKIFVEHMIEGA